MCSFKELPGKENEPVDVVLIGSFSFDCAFTVQVWLSETVRSGKTAWVMSRKEPGLSSQEKEKSHTTDPCGSSLFTKACT